jgi:hypothetical protein
MGQLPYKPQEPSEEWASRKGYLAHTPDTPESIEKQKQKRIEAEREHKETDTRFHEIIVQVNKQKGQTYFCGNCHAKVKINYNYCERCGYELIWHIEH